MRLYESHGVHILKVCIECYVLIRLSEWGASDYQTPQQHFMLATSDTSISLLIDVRIISAV